MAIIPGKKNFTIDRRADFPIRLTFKDSTGSAINLSGYTVAAQVYNEDRSTKFADWTVAYTDRTNGIVDISLSDTDTATFTPSILFCFDYGCFYFILTFVDSRKRCKISFFHGLVVVFYNFNSFCKQVIVAP